MAIYRVETRLINLSDDSKWEHAIEFDTDSTPGGIVKNRFQSIYHVMMRAIRKHENTPEPTDYPLTTRQGLPLNYFPEQPDADNG